MTVEGIGEVTIRKPGATVKLLGASEKDRMRRTGLILEDSVLYEGTPLWTADEWESWGGDEGNVLHYYELFLAVLSLGVPEKKTSPQTSSSPSESAE